MSLDRLKRVLALDGPEFLGQAYLLILGRPIDPEGFRNYEAQLRAGASKVAILAALAESQEGQARGADVNGVLHLLPRTQSTRIAADRVSGLPELQAAAGRSQGTSNMQDLLALHDVAFIGAAYRVLLGRAPDDTGFNDYLRLLRSGASKMQIVSQLCLSAEGRRAAPSLPGLRRAIRRYRLGNSWLIGRWYRAIAQVEGDTTLERRLRAVENTLMRMAHERERDSIELDTAAEDVARLLKALADRRSA